MQYTHWCTAIYEWFTMTLENLQMCLFGQVLNLFPWFLCGFMHVHPEIVISWENIGEQSNYVSMCIRPRCHGLTDTKLDFNVNVNCRDQVKHLNYFHKLCVTSTAVAATADRVNSWWAKSAVKLQQLPSRCFQNKLSVPVLLTSYSTSGPRLSLHMVCKALAGTHIMMGLLHWRHFDMSQQEKAQV